MTDNNITTEVLKILRCEKCNKRKVHVRIDGGRRCWGCKSELKSIKQLVKKK